MLCCRQSLFPALAIALSLALTAPALARPNPNPDAGPHDLIHEKRNGDHAHHIGAPLTVLNETEVTLYHSPTPPSYYSLDFEDDGYEDRHKGLMFLHGICMCLAFFVSLPVGIALRSVDHAAHSLATVSFYAFCALGCAASGLYRKLTPNMYEGAVHSKQSYIIILIALSLSALDILAFIRRFVAFVAGSEDRSPRAFWRHVVKKEDINVMDSDPSAAESEYVGLITDEPEPDVLDFGKDHHEHEHDIRISDSMELQDIELRNSIDSGDPTRPEQWAHNVHRHHHQHQHHQQHHQHKRAQSTASEGTLFGSGSHSSPGHSQDTFDESDFKAHLHNTTSTSQSTSPASRTGTGYLRPRLRPRLRLQLRRAGQIAFAVLERFLVVAGFAQVLVGVVTYSGGCRENYKNGCLAHLIKGGIFWCYGLLTFARFLGSFAEYGWAWNRAPSPSTSSTSSTSSLGGSARASGLRRGSASAGGHAQGHARGQGHAQGRGQGGGRRGGYSAEFVESLVIFLYGVTNTWMERFGANPGDPFTTKQIQHISIAVMFWFAGLLGMGIESRRVRGWLASSAFSSSSSGSPSESSSSSERSSGSSSTLAPHSHPHSYPHSHSHSPSHSYPPHPHEEDAETETEAATETEAVEEPPSYSASFNPFPALVIGVTGAAMAAHAQTYLFQVQIHALWGNLLVAFAVLRCLTYFFLWLGPPRSVLPSRPPTEALGSFFLACGGLVFMFSTEEVTIAAMRRGRDDVMMFLNLAVALTCLAFCWTLFVVGFKGWIKSRTMRSRSATVNGMFRRSA